MEYDVFIAGGGLTGTSLALALAPAAACGSLRVALAEAAPPAAAGASEHAPPPLPDVRALALADGSRRIFESLGVWAAIAPAVTPIERIHVSERGRFAVARLSRRELGIPALGYTIEIATLAAELWRALEDKGTAISRLCPAAVESVDIRDDHAVLWVRPGQRGQPVAVRTRLVVAADGGDSRLRAAAGIQSERIVYAQQALVASVALGRPHEYTAYERFTPEGPLALVPLAGRRAKLIWSTPQDRLAERLAWGDDEFLAHLQEHFGERLGTFSQPGPRRAYPLALTRVTELVRARLVLAGNAAHSVHPVAGQGFNLALRDVAALAEVLVQAARRGEDIGALPVLERYARWRAADHCAIQGLTHLLVRAFANEALPLVLLRDLGLLAVDLIPPLKRYLMRLTTGVAAGGRPPRLARGLPL